MTTTIYNTAGEKVGEAELNPSIFDVELNAALVKQAVLTQRDNSRQPIAHAKDRSEVRGGGRKPWRQKGTGRARHGSIRSPIWIGGGKSFGPRNTRNFSKKINRTAKQKALAMVLTEKARDNKLIVLDELALKEAKTKVFNAVIDKLPIEKRSVLTVLPKTDIKVVRATSNIPKVKTVLAQSLNILDVIGHNYVLVPSSSLDIITKTFSRVGKPVVNKKSAAKPKKKKIAVKKILTKKA